MILSMHNFRFFELLETQIWDTGHSFSFLRHYALYQRLKLGYYARVMLVYRIIFV